MTLPPGQHGPPVFVGEDQDPRKTYNFYHKYAKPSNTNYQTPLNPQDERTFRAWVGQNSIPFDPDFPLSDYDLRGYWGAYVKGHPNWLAEQAQVGTILPPGRNHPGAESPHFLDPRFETPYGAIFSRGSQYATPDNPYDWGPGKAPFIDTRSGQVVFDYPPEDQAALAAEPMPKLRGPGTGRPDDTVGPAGQLPPPGGAIWTPDGKGGGSYRPVIMEDRAPPVEDTVAGDKNPFRRGGANPTVGQMMDPAARRFDALSPADQESLARAGEYVKSGRLPMSVYVNESQRLLYESNPYGPGGSLPGEVGFFPPEQPTFTERIAGTGIPSAVGSAADFAAVLNQLKQTEHAISGAPKSAQGPMTLGTIGTVGTAASAAGAAATGLPMAGVAGIGIAGAAIPMAAATTFGAASGQEGTDPWGGVPHSGVGVAGPRASISSPFPQFPLRPYTGVGPAPGWIPAGAGHVGPAGSDDDIDYHALGREHGYKVGEHIKSQMAQAMKTLHSDLDKHLQTEIPKQFGG